ncbi:MAG: peptidylprolyl isomerase [Verrucomicrobiota bacterium]
MNPIRLTLSFLFLTLSLGAQEFQITSIAAKVNGHAITKKEVDSLLAPRRELLKTLYPRQGEIYQRRLKDARDKILESLINNEIVLSEVRGKANIPDYAVEQEVKRIVRENFNGKDAEFKKHLQETNQTLRSFRETQREKILVQAYRSQQFGDIPPPTDSEIKAHYADRKLALRDRAKDQVDYQKIFIRASDPLDPNITPERQLDLAESLAIQARGEADFATLAKENSDGAFADKGGLWEDVSRTDLRLAFGDAIFEETNNGDIIGPLKDPAGFTIVKIIKLKYGPSPSLSTKETRDRMKQEVDIKKRNDRYEKWINGLKRHAMITRNI